MHKLISITCLLMLASTVLAEELPRVKLEPIVRGIEKPVYVANDGVNDRLYIIEQPGRMRLYENGELRKRPFLDLSRKVNIEYECGLLCVAFHPDFRNNGLLYVNYTMEQPNLKTVVAEFKADAKAESVDLSTERIILTIDQPFVNHNGGQVQFGPDGMLYIGMGDGGNQKDPNNNGQNPRTLLAKILRIDVSARQGYAIPKDNPFVNNPDYRPEIYAMGMRNAWRFSFDRATGLMYEGDVGESQWEEVNLIGKGKNYGWSIREGAHDFKPHSPEVHTTNPIYAYHHANTSASITGGYVYRGKALPALVGWYVFGDYTDGRVFAIKYENGKVTGSGVLIDPKNPERTGGVRRPTQPSSFGEDRDGELYLCDHNGVVFKIVP